MAYTPTNWVTGQTPLSAANLNNIEQGISDLNSNINDLNNDIAEVDAKIVLEQSNITYTNGWTTKYKSGYALLAAYAIRNDASYPIVINQRTDGSYTLFAQNAGNSTQLTQFIWIKK